MCGDRRVLFPNSKGGLPAAEITLAEALREKGYATAHIGKWHLGIHPGGRPMDQGFDLSFGLPYSNDMDLRESQPKNASRGSTPPEKGWNVPLIRNGEVVERPTDQATLTKRYTVEAMKFIREHKASPFFLYFAHTFPHVSQRREQAGGKELVCQSSERYQQHAGPGQQHQRKEENQADAPQAEP